jgi:hypothetical protein
MHECERAEMACSRPGSFSIRGIWRAHSRRKWREMGIYRARSRQSMGGAHNQSANGGNRAYIVREPSSSAGSRTSSAQMAGIEEILCAGCGSHHLAHNQSANGGRWANTVRAPSPPAWSRTSSSQLAGIGHISCANPALKCAASRSGSRRSRRLGRRTCSLPRCSTR